MLPENGSFHRQSVGTVSLRSTPSCVHLVSDTVPLISPVLYINTCINTPCLSILTALLTKYFSFQVLCLQTLSYDDDARRMCQYVGTPILRMEWERDIGNGWGHEILTALFITALIQPMMLKCN